MTSRLSHRPVLYLDIDDTLLTFRTDVSSSMQRREAVPAPGAGDFVVWALERFEVRWLTTWCRSGEMAAEHLAELSTLLNVPASRLAEIGPADWSTGTMKVDGIRWLEHLVLGRAFYWVEDRITPRDHEILRAWGREKSYVACNVTEDASAVVKARAYLADQLAGARHFAAPPMLMMEIDPETQHRHRE